MSLPSDVRPLPLDEVAAPFDDPRFVYELKHDGYRALAFIEDGAAWLVSRNGRRMTRFASLAAELVPAIRANRAILDGEIVHLAPDGRSFIQPLLRQQPGASFVAFDLLWRDANDLRDLPLLERKRRLKRLVRPRSAVAYLDHIRGTGVALFAEVCRLDLEGIIAKPAASPYRMLGRRSPWLKVKNRDYSQAQGRGDLFGRPR